MEDKKMKISKNFVLQEFVYPEAFAKHGADAIDFIDKKLIDIAEFIRTKIGVPITINNWHTGGQFKESGLRNPNTTTGAKLSQHKLGKAIDTKAKGYDGQKWYDFVKANSKALYDLGVRRIEHKSLATTWLHIDLKEHGKKCIQVVDLVKVVEEINLI
ncbi:MAG: hypothetical protein EPO45_20325 [Sphingobium sp.]|nr:MAG: hypothetical protein EPO45_20325 [Sphingobium sp.]